MEYEQSLPEKQVLLKPILMHGLLLIHLIWLLAHGWVPARRMFTFTAAMDQDRRWHCLLLRMLLEKLKKILN